jgi:CCR4-NOT transcription complex subunit 6
MSRKDKYEMTTRRQQTYMSAEDVAAGRKSSWQGVEITGEC